MIAHYPLCIVVKLPRFDAVVLSSHTYFSLQILLIPRAKEFGLFCCHVSFAFVFLATLLQSQCLLLYVKFVQGMKM
jgi:hypothetical protein